MDKPSMAEDASVRARKVAGLMTGLASVFRAFPDAELWGRPEEAESAAVECESARDLLLHFAASRHPAPVGSGGGERLTPLFRRDGTGDVIDVAMVPAWVAALSTPSEPTAGERETLDETEVCVNDDIRARLDPAPDRQPISEPKPLKRRLRRALATTSKGETA